MTSQSQPRPAPIGWTDSGSFGAFTVAHRLPKIVAELDGASPAVLQRLTRWVGSLDTYRIDPDDFEAATPYFQEWVAARAGVPLTSLGFMHLEFLFYHLINSQLGVYHGAPDPFEPQKTSAGHRATARLDVPLPPGLASRPSLATALRTSLWGNLHDLSQVQTGSARAGMIVVDQSEALLACLRQAEREGRTVALIADNAGEELLSDLVLIDALFANGISSVTLHLKRWPMFVSDACPADLQRQLAALRSCAPGSAGRSLAERLDAAVASGSLCIDAAADWNEPRDFDALDPDFADALARCAIVLSKGDLNYRRHFGDRAWNIHMPLDGAGRGVGFRSGLLRVCKSELIVGVPVNAPLPNNSSWAIDGSTGLIQLL